MRRKSELADRVVRKQLADGSVKEYRYPRHLAPKREPTGHDSLAALIADFKGSPEWAAKADSTKQQYAIYLKPWEKTGGAARQVTRRDVLTIRDAIAATRGNGAASVFVRITSTLFSWAIEREWVAHNPATKIKGLPIGEFPAWTDDQVDAALDRFPEDLRRVVVLAIYTGQRRSDLCSMTWSSYDGKTIRLRQKKTKADLAIPVHPVLKAELDAWKAERGDSVQILHRANGQAWRPQKLSIEMQRWTAKIGFPAHHNVHGLRKVAARRLAEAGCSTNEIAAVTGHKTLGMVQHYTRSADQERLAGAAISRLSDNHKSIRKTSK